MSSDPLAAQVRQRKAWLEFSYSIDGRIEHGDDYTSRVHAPDYRGWEFLIDIFESRDDFLGRRHWWTRIRAPYQASSSIRFQVHPARRVARARRLLGRAWGSSFLTGFAEIDRSVVIRTDSERELRQLLSEPKIPNMLVDAVPVDLEIGEVFAEGVSAFRERIEELQFRERGRISDADRLKALVELLAEMLDQLQEMGVATRRDKTVYAP